MTTIMALVTRTTPQPSDGDVDLTLSASQISRATTPDAAHAASKYLSDGREKLHPDEIDLFSEDVNRHSDETDIVEVIIGDKLQLWDRNNIDEDYLHSFVPEDEEREEQVARWKARQLVGVDSDTSRNDQLRLEDDDDDDEMTSEAEWYEAMGLDPIKDRVEVERVDCHHSKSSDVDSEMSTTFAVLSDNPSQHKDTTSPISLRYEESSPGDAVSISSPRVSPPQPLESCPTSSTSEGLTNEDENMDWDIEAELNSELDRHLEQETLEESPTQTLPTAEPETDIEAEMEAELEKSLLQESAEPASTDIEAEMEAELEKALAEDMQEEPLDQSVTSAVVSDKSGKSAKKAARKPAKKSAAKVDVPKPSLQPVEDELRGPMDFGNAFKQLNLQRAPKKVVNKFLPAHTRRERHDWRRKRSQRAEQRRTMGQSLHKSRDVPNKYHSHSSWTIKPDFVVLAENLPLGKSRLLLWSTSCSLYTWIWTIGVVLTSACKSQIMRST